MCDALHNFHSQETHPNFKQKSISRNKESKSGISGGYGGSTTTALHLHQASGYGIVTIHGSISTPELGFPSHRGFLPRPPSLKKEVSLIMDPITVLTSAGALITTCVTITKTVQRTVEGLQNAPGILKSIVSECNVYTRSLEELEVFLPRLGIARRAHDPRGTTINDALGQIHLTLTKLKNEVGRAAGSSSNLGIRGKLRVHWNKDVLDQLLSQLRGQHSSLSCLTSTLTSQTILNNFDKIHKADHRASTQASEVQNKVSEAVRNKPVQTMPDLTSRFGGVSLDDLSSRQYGNYRSTQAAYPNTSRRLVMNEQAFNEMITAMANNDLRTIQSLLDRGYDLNYTLDEYERVTPLHLATAGRDIDLVQRFLGKGARINSKTSPGGASPLTYAAELGDIAMLRLLLGKGAIVDNRDDYGLTPMHSAANGGFTEVVIALLGKGANVGAEGSDGLQALHLAAGGGHSALTRTLIRRGASVNATTHDGFTPLHLAAATSGTADAVRTLVNEGADVDKRDSFGASPLDLAVSNSNLEAADILLNHGASLDPVDYLSLPFPPPLGMAVASGSLEMIRLLVEAGASFDLAGFGSALFLAVSEAASNEDVVSLLIDLGADVDGRDASNYDSELQSPALAAAVVSKFSIVTVLVDRGANITRKHRVTGRTLLHEVAIRGPIDLARRIIRRNPEMALARDEFGETPVDYATSSTASEPGMANFLRDQVMSLLGVKYRPTSMFGTAFGDEPDRLDFALPSKSLGAKAGCDCPICRELSTLLNDMPAVSGCNCASCTSKKNAAPALPGCNCASCSSKKRPAPAKQTNSANCSCADCLSKKQSKPNSAPPNCNCRACQEKAATSAIPSLSPLSPYDDDFLGLPRPRSRGPQHSNCSCSLCRTQSAPARSQTPQPRYVEPPSTHSRYVPGCPCPPQPPSFEDFFLATLQSAPPPPPPPPAPPQHSIYNPNCPCPSCESAAIDALYFGASLPIYLPPPPPSRRWWEDL